MLGKTGHFGSGEPTQVKASKEIKEIQKSRKPRKTKRSILPPIGKDTLCEKCGKVFSDSVDGTGWKSCFNCAMWFHDECFLLDEGKCSECS